MISFIATDLHLHKILKIIRVLFFGTQCSVFFTAASKVMCWVLYLLDTVM